MKEVLNECVGCPPEIGCMGDSCPYRHVTRYYCDECENETQLYEFDGGEYCISCIEKMLSKIN